MLNKEEIVRYKRHLALPEIGLEGQLKLKKAKVLVIGAGGLGCPALLYLTAAGIGEIGIIDFDKVEESNLQRQVLYSSEDVGKLKTEVAVSKLSKQNPFVKINAYPFRIDTINAFDIIVKYDIIIDGTDSFSTRYLVNDACVLMNRPFIYGSIHKFEGQLSVLNYTDNLGKIGPTYRCLFPSPPKSGSTANCSEIGVFGVLPGIVGNLQAAEAIKIITGIGQPFSGKLLLFNALSLSFSEIEIERNMEWVDLAPKSKEEFREMDYDYLCGNEKAESFNKSITVEELRLIIGNKDIQILDVRDVSEGPQIKGLQDLNIPLENILDQAHLISKSKKTIVFCKSGIRSRKAIQILEKDFGYTNLYNLDGGITEWLAEKQFSEDEINVTT